jgi:hypothetical protein
MSVIVDYSQLYDRCVEYFQYEDGKLFWKKNKGVMKVGMEAGSYTQHYKQLKLDGKRYLVSRLVYLMHHGNLPKYVDHINNDTWDNRIENLRAATSLQNNHNRVLSVKNKTGVKGVFWDKNVKKYKAQITYNYKQMHLGFYQDLELAELVVSMAREKYHGKFAHDGTPKCQ